MPDDLPPLDDSPPPADEQSETERRMRRALGLRSDAAADKTGGGPAKASAAGPRRQVTTEAANRMVEARAALAAERLAREQAEAALSHAEEALRDAEARRVHAELARDEAVAALASERSARDVAEQMLRQANVSAQPVAPAETPRRRGRPPNSARPPAVATSNDAPVKWWIPGWKARLPGTG